MNRREILVKAAKEVERGWCQYALEDSDGNVCAVGAIYKAMTGDACLFGYEVWTPARTTAYKSCLKAITRVIGAPFDEVAHSRVVDFNNAEGRTQAEVVKVLRKAARI